MINIKKEMFKKKALDAVECTVEIIENDNILGTLRKSIRMCLTDKQVKIRLI